MNSVASSGPYTLKWLGARSVRWFADVDGVLERSFWPIVIALTAILFAVLLTADFQLKLWNDELIGLFVARSPSLSQIAAMTMAGADATPPLYSVMVHTLLPYSPSEALAVRLPSTIGFCAMVVAVAGFARRWLPAAYAMIAGLLAAAMTIYYGSEGRSYGLILGFAALSLLLWSLAAEGRRRSLTLPLLAVCIAGMAALHYYTIFFPACLCLAQLVHARAERRFDFLLAIVLLAPAAIVVAAHYPFIAATRPFMAHNYSTPSVQSILYSYELFLKWPVVLFAAAMLTATFISGFQGPPPRAATVLPARELTALVLIALAPIGVVAINMMTTDVFTHRYILWSAVGIAILSALVLRLFARQNPVVGVTMILALIAGLSGREISYARHWSRLLEGDVMLTALSSLPHGDEPIVLTDFHVFLELSYYAQAALRQRLIYPICPDLEVRYLGYDTDAINMAGLKQWTSLNGVQCDEALEPGRDYIVAMTPTGFLPWPLEDKSFTVVPLYMDSQKAMVFRVRREARNL